MFFLQAVKLNLLTECKCHGVSGSCTMKTCWKSLPPFRTIGDSLMKKYYRARPVTSTYTTTKSDKKSEKKLQLVLKKGKMPIKKPPKKSELVFLQMSPNYCEKDLAAGSLGTVGRICNRTSEGRFFLLLKIKIIVFIKKNIEYISSVADSPTKRHIFLKINIHKLC